MTDDILNIQHLRSWIGHEQIASDVISSDIVRRFRTTFDITPVEPAEDEVAPLLINYCIAQPSALTRLLGGDGHPQRGSFLPPVPLPRRMWAGSSLVFHGDLRIGDTVRCVSRIADVSLKEGRSGLLCFVSVEHKIDVAGSLKIEENQKIVYREAASAHDLVKHVAAKPAPAGTNSRAIAVSPPLLFRYSALTFNAHRIHYDRRYATEVEHYPGLVFHGPLQATLLLHYAAELKGKAPKRFAFRAISPLFDNDTISLHADYTESGMTLWTARDAGPVAMSAEAAW